MSQTEKLLTLLRDFQWHSTDEILEKVYGGRHLGIARISARVWDAQKKLPSCQKIISRRLSKTSTLWEYRIIPYAQPSAEPRLFGDASCG